MKTGIIRTNPEQLLVQLGFNGIKLVGITVDIFSNQVILEVTGDIERFPISIEEKPKFKAVTGL